MAFPLKLKLPSAGFTFKLATPKTKKVPSSHKPLTKILYCSARKDENGNWQAYVNTKGLPDMKDITILPFTEKSFDLKGRVDVFYHNPDKYGHYTRIIRTPDAAMFYPGNKETYCTLCPKCVFSGHIVKVNGVTQFDISVYMGTDRQCSELLTMTNRIKKNEEED